MANKSSDVSAASLPSELKIHSYAELVCLLFESLCWPSFWGLACVSALEGSARTR